MKLVEFLIMENLPDSGEKFCISKLENNVMNDFFSMKKQADPDIFDIALRNLNEKQYVFINRKEKSVTATQYGINKTNRY